MTGKKPGITVEIRSINLNSHIVPSLNGKPVNVPNWEPGVDLNDNGWSKRPGVFEIDNSQYSGLTVKIKIHGMSPGDTGVLTGELHEERGKNRITFSGPVKNCDTTQQVTVLPQPDPENFSRLIGNIKWKIKFSDRKVARIPRTTRMELYWIFHHPAKMFHRRGVWIEVLRLLDQICLQDETKNGIIEQIVHHCHSRAGVRYDSYYGSCYFTDGGEGGLFKLKTFLEEVIAVCNCYDQAGAVQTLAGAVGIKVDWLYMNPFGFINTALLAGHGKCNNPLFLSKSDETHVPKKIVDINDSKRTGFYNHAFCGIKKGNRVFILDACAGPHTGDEPEQYLEKSIDTKTILYNKDGIPHPGTKKDIKQYPGILQVDVLGCEKPGGKKSCEFLNRDRRVTEFKKRIGFDAWGKDTGSGSDQGVVCNWGNTLDCIKKMFFYPVFTNENKIFDNTHFGCFAGMTERIYRKKQEWLRIEIFVSNKGIEAAKERLFKIAAATTMADIPFSKGPENIGHLCVTADKPGRKKTICVFHNICFLVEAHDSDIDVHNVLNRLCTIAQGHLVDNLGNYVPKIGEVIVSPTSRKIKTGKEVKMGIISAPCQYQAKDLLLLFLMEGDSLVFEHEEFFSEENKRGSLRFRGKSPGVTGVFPILANWQNLLCSTREVKITVT